MSETKPTCPECMDTVSPPDNAELGEIIDCTSCGSELEVVDTNPFEFDIAPELDEDWGE